MKGDILSLNIPEAPPIKDGKIDPTLALARAVIVSERIYDLAVAAKNEEIRAQTLLLMAHLRVARSFAS